MACHWSIKEFEYRFPFKPYPRNTPVHVSCAIGLHSQPTRTPGAESYRSRQGHGALLGAREPISPLPRRAWGFSNHDKARPGSLVNHPQPLHSSAKHALFNKLTFCLLQLLPLQGGADWLKEGAISLHSVSESVPQLNSALGESTVVFLGEPTHADGSVFEAKIQMVKTLHEQHSFDVLVFESGLHGCDAAWRAFKKGEQSPTRCAAEGIFPIWTQSAQMLPLWDYLAERAASDRPLELAGYDSQITGRASAKLAEDLATQMTAAGIPTAKQAPILGAANLAHAGEGFPNWKKRGKAIQRGFFGAGDPQPGRGDRPPIQTKQQEEEAGRELQSP